MIPVLWEKTQKYKEKYTIYMKKYISYVYIYKQVTWMNFSSPISEEKYSH